MISAGDFRKGVTIEYNGNVYVVVEFQHVASFQLACLYPAFPDHVERMPKRCLNMFPSCIDLDKDIFLVAEQLYDRL